MQTLRSTMTLLAPTHSCTPTLTLYVAVCVYTASRGSAHALVNAVLRNIFWCIQLVFFFFNDTATTEIYTLSLHDALLFFFKEHAAHRHPHSSLPRRLPV